MLPSAAVALEAVTGQPSPCDRKSLPPSRCAAATVSAEMPRSVEMVFEASCGSTCPLCGALLKYQCIRSGRAAQRRDGRGTNPPSPPHTALQSHRRCILGRGWPVGGRLPSPGFRDGHVHAQQDGDVVWRQAGQDGGEPSSRRQPVRGAGRLSTLIVDDEEAGHCLCRGSALPLHVMP